MSDAAERSAPDLYECSKECKLAAVRLSRVPGMQVKAVAAALSPRQPVRPWHDLASALHHPPMFIAVWEFQINEGARLPFEAMYGPQGAWVALFRSDPAYRGSELLGDRQVRGRYLTVDRWDSADAYHAFKQREAVAYAALDAQGDGLTSRERLLGEFELATEAHELWPTVRPSHPEAST